MLWGQNKTEQKNLEEALAINSYGIYSGNGLDSGDTY